MTIIEINKEFLQGNDKILIELDDETFGKVNTWNCEQVRMSKNEFFTNIYNYMYEKDNKRLDEIEIF
jgi:hypothetical protein